jgi:hypothetical protein
MPFELAFDDDFPRLRPDPPRAHVQFSVKWRCTNVGDEASPEVGVRIDVLDGTGPVLTAIGRNVVPLLPGESDEDVVDVGAVGSGTGTVEVTVDGLSAIIPITVS